MALLANDSGAARNRGAETPARTVAPRGRRQLSTHPPAVSLQGERRTPAAPCAPRNPSTQPRRAGPGTARPPSGVAPRGRRRLPNHLAFLPALVALLAPLAPMALRPAVAAPSEVRDVEVYVPGGLATEAAAGSEVPPAQVVLVLHGMGGAGRAFSPLLVEAAEREGWVLVAPALAFGDWRDPSVVQEEDAWYTQQLVALLDALPAQTGIPLATEAYVLGYSRGAQLGHRLALLYPERVAAAAVFAAGTYTLPVEGPDLSFPYGLADCSHYTGHCPDWPELRDTPILVGVGAEDTIAEGLPRAWDSFEGQTRVERARAFVDYLLQAGMPGELHLFPGVGHALRPEMHAAAVTFFRNGAYEPADASPEGDIPWGETPGALEPADASEAGVGEG
jgi:predicted esterase